MERGGPALFSDDLACDVRDDYRELLEDQVSDSEATRRILEQYAGSLADPDEASVVWLGLAVTQSKVGRLETSVRDEALRVIDSGGRQTLARPCSPTRETAGRAGDEQYALPRVARIDHDRSSVAPILVVLDFDGAQIPEAHKLKRIHDRTPTPFRIDGSPLPPWHATCYRVMAIKSVDYADVGFERVGPHTERRGLVHGDCLIVGDGSVVVNPAL